MLNQIKKFMLDDSGLETVEWAIVGGIVVVAGAVIFATIGTDVKTALGNLQGKTAAAALSGS
jgi:Flp pilus assembly pilin Flp